jgi:hypothetical protein
MLGREKSVGLDPFSKEKEKVVFQIVPFPWDGRD